LIIHFEYLKKANQEYELLHFLRTIEAKIIRMIAENAKISIPQIALNIGKGITATKMHINNLKKLGRIKRIGADKGGHWVVV